MDKRVKLLAVGLVAAGLMVVSVGGVALAQEPADAGDIPAYGGHGWGGQHGQVATCSVVGSDLLGLTPEELCAQRLEGKSLVEIAAAQGVSEEALVEAIMSARNESVQASVEAGTITQERADFMLQQMEQRASDMLNRTTFGPPEWGRGQGSGAYYGDTELGTGPGGMHGRGGR